MRNLGLKMEIKTELLAIFITYLFSDNMTVRGFLDIEELKSIHYGIDILSEPVMWTTEENIFSDNSIKVMSKYGQSYKCSFPDRIEADKKKEEEEKVAMEMGIPELLKPMESGPCLFKNKDWWSYEFCYGKHIRQFHVEEGKIVGEVTIMGYYESEFDWNNETNADKVSSNNNRLNRYHSQSYINGTLCDLTQKQRKTEVRFLCDDSAGDYIGRIDEPETCTYILTVYTSKICHHPYLRPPTRNIPVPITCNPLLTQNQYSEYMQEVEAENKRIQEEKEKLQKEKEKIQKEKELEKQQEKSEIENSLNTKLTEDDSIGDAAEKDEGVNEESELAKQTQALADMKNLDSLLEKTVGDNMELEKLLKTSLDKEMSKYMKGLEVPQKDLKFKVIKNLDDLKLAMEEVAKETETFLSRKNKNNKKSQELDEDLTEEEQMKKDAELSEQMDDLQSTEKEQARSGDKKFEASTETEMSDEDKALLEEFDRGLDEMDLADYKELFLKNRQRFAAVKKKIQENMRAQFDDILQEAGEELGLDKKKMNLEKQKSFAEMADTLNKLLLKLEKTEKDIKKVDREINELKEKEEEQDNEAAESDDTKADKNPPEDQVKGPVRSLDDRVKVRVTKLRRSDLTKMQKDLVSDTKTQHLEKEVQNGLEKAGLDIGGGKIQVKIITAKYDDDDSSIHMLSDDETKAFTNMIVSILEGDDEVSKEEQKHSSMERGYNFVWGKNKKKHNS